MVENQCTINEWQQKTFPTATAEGAINHLKEEFLEFLDAPTVLEAAEEAADVVILLYCWASYYEIDIQQEIEKKMAKNRAREWNIQSDGTGRHK